MIHEQLMREKLEEWKLRTAREIAAKRRAGIPVKAHALTSEAMIAQQAENIQRAQKAFVEQQVSREFATKVSERKEFILKKIERIREIEPDIDVGVLAERLGKPRSTVYRYLCELRKAS